jgi:hypothetical protein
MENSERVMTCKSSISYDGRISFSRFLIYRNNQEYLFKKNNTEPHFFLFMTGGIVFLLRINID